MAARRIESESVWPMPSEEERAAARYDPAHLGRYPKIVLTTENFDSDAPQWVRADLDEIARFKKLIDGENDDDEDPPEEAADLIAA